MKKKILLLTFALCIILSVFALSGCHAIGDNVVTNGTFGTLAESGQVSDWDIVNLVDQEDNSYGSVTWKADNDPQSQEYIEALGERYVEISISSNPSVIYAGQKVKLQTGSVYKLSAYIKVSTAITGTYSDSVTSGARVGFLEDKDFKAISVTAVNSEWQLYEVFITPATAKPLTLVAGIGDETMGKAKGKAAFGGIVLEKVAKSAAEGSTIYTVKHGTSYNLSDGASITYTVIGMVLTAVIAYLAYFVIRKQLAKTDLANQMQKTAKPNPFGSPLAMFLYVLSGAFIVRLILALVLQGQGVEIDALSNTALHLVDYGPVKFFEHDVNSMPFGTLYILWALGGFSNLAGIQFGSVGMAILMRLPMIVADIVSCYMLFSFASRFYNAKISACFAGLWALMPFAFTAAGAWGMSMSLSVCFIFAAFIAALDKKYITLTVCYTFAIITENLSLLLFPIVLGYLIYYFVKEKSARVKIGVTFGSCLLAMLLLSLPFTFDYVAKGQVFFVFQKYYQAFAGMAYLNDDIFNMYSLFGLANQPSNTALNVLNIIFVITLSLTALWLFIKTKDRMNLLLLSATTVLVYAIVGVKASLPVMLLGLALMLLYVIVSAEKRVFNIFVGFGGLYFLNMSQLMGQSGYLSNNPNAADVISFNAIDPFLMVFSLLSMALLGYLCWVVYDICIRSNEREILPLEGSVKTELWRLITFKKQI